MGLSYGVHPPLCPPVLRKNNRRRYGARSVTETTGSASLHWSQGLLGTSEGPSISLRQTYLGSSHPLVLWVEHRGQEAGVWRLRRDVDLLHIFFGSLATDRRWFSVKGWKTTLCMKLVSSLTDIPYPSTMGKHSASRSISKSTEQGGELMCFPMVLSPLTGEGYSSKPFWWLINVGSIK